VSDAEAADLSDAGEVSNLAARGEALYVDTSALVRRYVHHADRRLVLDAMADATAWCSSSLAHAECQLALRVLSAHPDQHDRLAAALRSDWDAFWVVPLDRRCLARAAELGARFGLRTVDALHLAAADRLPRPVAYLTFDRRQIPAATGLGFRVISPLA
jgi:predicted nucleic acid-binding protein